MVNSRYEEKTRQEIEAGTAGEETCALQRGPKEGVGSGEEEINADLTMRMVHAGLRVYEYFSNSQTEKSKPNFSANLVTKIYLEMLSQAPHKRVE